MACGAYHTRTAAHNIRPVQSVLACQASECENGWWCCTYTSAQTRDQRRLTAFFSIAGDKHNHAALHTAPTKVRVVGVGVGGGEWERSRGWASGRATPVRQL